MTITGLELRRATWEALGWQFVQQDGLWTGLRSDGTPLKFYDDIASMRCIETLLLNCVPPIELNNGIALDELLKFCERTEWKVADIRIIADSRFNTFKVELCKPSSEIEELGTSLAECICRALIQAASVKA